MNHGERIKADILSAGLSLWRDEGVEAVTALRIARTLDMTRQGVAYHFGNSATLRTAVAAHALDARDVAVVCQMITARHPLCEGMTGEERAGWLGRCG